VSGKRESDTDERDAEENTAQAELQSWFGSMGVFCRQSEAHGHYSVHQQIGFQ
jgi:hypothetical protein